MLDHINQCKEHVILLDEPDANLFILKQYELVDTLKKISKNKQIIMSCHSQVFFNIGNTIYLKGDNKVEYYKGDLDIKGLNKRSK